MLDPPFSPPNCNDALPPTGLSSKRSYPIIVITINCRICLAHHGRSVILDILEISRFTITNVARDLPLARYAVPMIKHSPMPVSAEKDKDLLSLPAIEIKNQLVVRCLPTSTASIFAKKSPVRRDSGMTIAQAYRHSPAFCRQVPEKPKPHRHCHGQIVPVVKLLCRFRHRLLFLGVRTKSCKHRIRRIRDFHAVLHDWSPA